MSLDLKPEKVKPYLKLLTEAIVNLSANKGSLRKDIWDYLNKKYAKSIDYRDFLLAIRKFLLEGKLINVEGLYHMHHEVIQEVREKTPTPVFKKNSEGKPLEANIFMKFLKGDQDGVVGSATTGQSSSKKKAKFLVASKVSQSGKKQKVKEDAIQSTIDRYYMKKQISHSDFREYDNHYENQNKKLGFATPAFETKVFAQQEEDKPTPKKEAAAKRLGIHSKQRDQSKRNHLRKKILDYNINQQSKRISKQKKFTSNISGGSAAAGRNILNSGRKQTKSNRKQLSEDSPKSLNLSEDQKQIVEDKSAKRLEESTISSTNPSSKFQKNANDFQKQELKDKKDKLTKKTNEKLTVKILKELKKAVQRKNLVMRKERLLKSKKQAKQSKDHQEDLPQSREEKKQVAKVATKQISEKSKKIKKLSKKQRALKQIRSTLGYHKIVLQRLRGKTLDLTKLGIIKKKKPEEAPKPKDQPIKTAKERGRPKKVQDERSKSISRSQSRSTSQIKKEQSKQRSQSKDKTLKKRPYTKRSKSTSKKQKTVKKVTKVIRKVKQPKYAKPLKKAKKAKKPAVVKTILLDLDRKAKLDAVKALKQLFSKDKLKDDIYVDGKLIYL